MLKIAAPINVFATKIHENVCLIRENDPAPPGGFRRPNFQRLWHLDSRHFNMLPQYLLLKVGAYGNKKNKPIKVLG